MTKTKYLFPSNKKGGREWTWKQVLPVFNECRFFNGS